MAEMRPAIGMADALTAARALELTTPHELGRLSRLLGLSVAREDDGGHDEVLAPPPRPSPPDAAGSASSTWETPTATVRKPRPPDEGRRTFVEQLSDEPAVAIEWEPAAVLHAPSPEVATVKFAPIVPEHQLRAALATMLRRPRPSRRPDVARLVWSSSRCRPLREIPQEIEQSLSLGVAVVADVGPAMLPLLADVAYFVDQVKHVAGDPNVLVTWTEEAAAPPDVSLDRPVLLISSLGTTSAPAGRPGSGSRWRALFAGLLSGGVDVVALVPHRRTVDRTAVAPRVVAWDDLPLVGRGRV